MSGPSWVDLNADHRPPLSWDDLNAEDEPPPSPPVLRDTLTFFCVICLGDIEPSEMHTTCDNGHTCCSECYQGLVLSGSWECPTCRGRLRGHKLRLQASTDPREMSELTRRQLQAEKKTVDVLKKTVDVLKEEKKEEKRRQREDTASFHRSHRYRLDAGKKAVKEMNRLRDKYLSAKVSTEYDIKNGVFSKLVFPPTEMPPVLDDSPTREEISKMKKTLHKLTAAIHRKRTELSELEKSHPSLLSKIRKETELDGALARKTKDNELLKSDLDKYNRDIVSATEKLSELYEKERILAKISELESHLVYMRASKEVLHKEVYDLSVKKDDLVSGGSITESEGF